MSAEKPLYYADGGTVFKRPIEQQNDDGSRNIEIGFPVCVMHEAAGDDAAQTVADLMNRGSNAPDIYAALKYARRFLNKSDHDTGYVDDALAGFLATEGAKQ